MLEKLDMNYTYSWVSILISFTSTERQSIKQTMQITRKRIEKKTHRWSLCLCIYPECQYCEQCMQSWSPPFTKGYSRTGKFAENCDKNRVGAGYPLN